MRNWTVRRQLLALVGLLSSATLIVAAVGLVFISSEEGKVSGLVHIYRPAVTLNADILQTVTDVQTALPGYLAAGGPGWQHTYTRAESQSRAELAQLRGLLDSERLSAPKRDAYERLASVQADTIDRWWRYVGALQGGTSARLADLAASNGLFDQVRTANVALGSSLTADQASLRDQADQTLSSGVRALLAAAALAVLAGLGAVGRISRTVTRPIARLRQVALRQQEGDAGARADEDHGPAEIRGLAVAFNAMTGRNAELADEQSEALRLQRAVAAAGRSIREASDVRGVMDIACAVLGGTLHARRVMATAHGEEPEIIENTQWHAPDLPDLPDIPKDLTPRLWKSAEEMWKGGGTLVVDDLVDGEAARHAWARRFHRETGATALIMAPIGLGRRVIGALYVVADTGPRQWTQPEVSVVQQLATYVARAITQAEREAELAEYTSRLESLDRQKTEFLSTVSHELRTPLTSIQGYLELLRDQDAGPLADDQQHMLGIIERNTVRLRGLIEDLLVLNRIETGGLSAGAAEVSLCGLAVNTAEELQPVAGKAGVCLDIRTGTDPALVKGEPVQLQRVLVNILSNAIKFTPRDGEVMLSCEADQAAGEAIVVCRDTGIGIPKADLEHMFTRFFRASNATRRAIPGTGLGLAIVQAIVEVHGGTLALDSVEGKGTTVTVRFPLIRPEAG